MTFARRSDVITACVRGAVTRRNRVVGLRRVQRVLRFVAVQKGIATVEFGSRARGVETLSQLPGK